MRKVNLLKKSGVVGIIVIFICASFVSSIGGYSEDTSQLDIDIEDVCEFKEDVLVTCNTFGFAGEPTQETTMSISEAEFLYNKIKELQIEVARDPLSDKTQQLQHEIIILADEHALLPAGLSVETLKSRLTPSPRPQHPQRTPLPRLQNKASEMFCNYVSTGSGTSLPIIILPRLIPILLTPIPRLFVRWKTSEGITSCGGLRSGTGFIATGAQNGIALGFWGIGFSIFLPPVMAYGLFGYALFASVTAEEIELWPPNYPPEISAVSPMDGAENIPISTSELSFHISDLNEDPMSYSVTTTPDIGSGSGNNKPDGAYTVPISGLEGSEEYTWQVEVSDGVNNVATAFTFTTEPVAPIVSNPIPEDDARYVPVDLSQLSFHLSDPQGDLMDYTVETYPDIGSASGTNVGDGTYTMDVIGLDYTIEYTWYINVTDGIYWKHKVFSFQTEPKMVFDPFAEGWQYRKQITIDHTKVVGDLENFPVLISTIDSDLHDKAQDDGDDILFMNDTGVATRLYHEIEEYDSSSGELVAWVNVTDLASNLDTVLYMYYDNPSSCNQQTPELVWDSNYKSVWHLSEDGIGTRYDSTFNDHDGTPYSYDGDEGIDNGMIDGADDFDGNNDHIRTGISFDFEYRTVTFWFNTDGKPSSDPYDTIIAQDADTLQYGGVVTYIQSDGIHAKAGGESSPPAAFIYNIDIHSWYMMHLVRNGPVTEFYVNGNLEGTSVSGDLGSSWDPNPNLVIAARRCHDRTFDGTLDEIRISNIARSPVWISTEYTNQNEPNSFYTIGPEETGP